ncbi:MAG: SUMF1/EgtB/PvdO family nonheme iron enzyme [Deltaproteobacteria bacterium]|nr:SUMF1/EgtB/PvdO family nonheme iron enzyme [Deltaproteobacteria bacterium]
MRWIAATTLVALAGVSAASDGERPRGKTVRIEKPPRREVVVPAGTFRMGVDEDQANRALDQCQLAYFPPNAIPRQQIPSGGFIDFCTELHKQLTHMPPRDVFVDAFAIDRNEVSVMDYRRCVDAGACALDALVAGDERYIRGDWPMVNVTWEDANTYCSWRGGRLPTEAEWERAAVGDVPNSDWPWGELEQPKDFNHGQARAVAMREIERQVSMIPLKFFGDPDDSDGALLMSKPGSYPWGESPFGTRDQAGNVAEWTADAFFTDDLHVGYVGLSAINPLREGPLGQPRVIRGGSWRQPTFVAKSNLRDPFNPYYDATQRFSHVGFRCARTIR